MTELNTIIDQAVLNPLKNDVFSIAFLMLALLLASVWHNFLIVFVHKAREMVLSHDWRSFEAENANSGPRLRFSLAVVSVGSSSIFAYQLVHFSTSLEVPYWGILAGFTAIHFVRMIITRFIEYNFVIGGGYEIWVESYTWIHFVTGVLYFPLAILMTYSPESTFSICTNIALVVFILGEMLLFYRLFSVFYAGIASLFYLFLYLCALEILPLLIVFRILS